MHFEWDSRKAASNLLKHGVAFDEAQSCFFDPLQIAFADPDHSLDEDRDILFGRSEADRLLVVVYTLRKESIRLISARPATRRESKKYAERIQP